MPAHSSDGVLAVGGGDEHIEDSLARGSCLVNGGCEEEAKRATAIAVESPKIKIGSPGRNPDQVLVAIW